MSLKTLHLISIVLATALALGFGVWALDHGHPGLAGASFAAVVALVVYGIWFLKETKGVGYL